MQPQRPSVGIVHEPCYRAESVPLPSLDSQSNAIIICASTSWSRWMQRSGLGTREFRAQNLDCRKPVVTFWNSPPFPACCRRSKNLCPTNSDGLGNRPSLCSMWRFGILIPMPWGVGFQSASFKFPKATLLNNTFKSI